MNYYRKNAKEYIESTFNVDMEDSYKAFLNLVKKKGTILDLGCGSGRDSLFFLNKGYEVYALDSVPEFCEHAKSIGIKNIICKKIQDLNYKNKFNGIWASASLLHLKNHEIIDALNKCHKALVSNGVMYASFKLGDFTGIKDNRFYNDMTIEKFDNILKKTKFSKCIYNIRKDILKRNNSWLEIILHR